MTGCHKCPGENHSQLAATSRNQKLLFLPHPSSFFAPHQLFGWSDLGMPLQRLGLPRVFRDKQSGNWPWLASWSRVFLVFAE